jgi:predicted permease
MPIAGDLRFALRNLRAHPGFTAIAVASLALGIGANTAIFSLVDQVLLWSLPAREPSRLVQIDGGRITSYPFFREYRDRNQVFAGILASSQPVATGVRPDGAPAVEIGKLSYVTGNYFELLGLGAAAGRVLTPADDEKPGGSPTVVLSYNYWQRRFAGSPDVIGRKFSVNGYPLEIAGVAEKGFIGIFNGRPADAFLPLTIFPVTNPAAAPVWNTPALHWLSAIARLRPGVSVPQAQAAMRVLWPQAVEAVNDAAVKRGGKSRKFDKEDLITLKPAARGFSGNPDQAIDPLLALLVATGLVLLIACANVANLLLARASGRQKEIAVRLAMGATRLRLIRQLLTESALLSVLGGLAGIVLAFFGVQLLAYTGLVRSELRFQPSLAVAAFCTGVTVATAFLFGLIPAFRATGDSLVDAIKDGTASSQSGARLRAGKVLVAFQVALSLTLLVGAGLFIRTLRNLQNVDLGFQHENVTVIEIDPSKLGYKGHRLRTFYDRLLEGARTVRGVRSAALGGMTPMGNFIMSRSFSAEGYQPKPDERLLAASNAVTSGYFTTLGIPMLLGRDFRSEDEPAVTPADGLFAAIGRMSGGGSEALSNASRLCIISESLARRLFPDGALGRHISFDDPYRSEDGLEVIGVVKEIRNYNLRRKDDMGMIFTPSWSNGAEVRSLIVRTVGDSTAVLLAIRAQLRDLDANVPLLSARTLDESIADQFSRERMIAWLCGCFGALALLLASVGLYGVLAYAVTRRTREVGIRMALGARRGDVVGMIVRESLAAVIAGTAIGLAVAFALTRFVEGMLFGVAARDPLSYLLAAGVMLAVALAAAVLPARRASLIEPTTALRYE